MYVMFSISYENLLNSNGQEASDCSLQPQDTPFTNFTKAGLSSHYSHIVSKFFPSIPFNHHRF
jgi:hypothetical protein